MSRSPETSSSLFPIQKLDLNLVIPQYLTKALPNPNGRAVISLNFEKFLLDASGRPLRRYPRKYTVLNSFLVTYVVANKT